MTDCQLNPYCAMMLEEFDRLTPQLLKIQEIVVSKLNECVKESGIFIDGIASRIKDRNSLIKKLERKCYKYESLNEITDLIGARVITFYTDDVDKISSLIDKYFIIDWENSVDKRKSHDLDRFGYNSLHYICSIPEEMYHDPEYPEINKIRFEIQMRTALQHVWATIFHDNGYKTDVEIPREHLRNMLRLAGMLELADEQFSQIRTEINNYRRQVQGLVADGQFDNLPLDGDSYASYLCLNPFDKLNRKIAAINQAEIMQTSLNNYLQVFRFMELKTLGDLDRMVKENSEEAYTLAAHQIGRTDLDILSSSIGIQNICSIHMIKHGEGLAGLKKMFDILEGPSDYNIERAREMMEDARAAIKIGN